MSRLPIAVNVEMKKPLPITPPVFSPVFSRAFSSEYDLWSSSSPLNASFLTDAKLASQLSIVELREESGIAPPPGLEPWVVSPITSSSLFSNGDMLRFQYQATASSTPSVSDASSTPSSGSTPDLSSGADEFGLDEITDDMTSEETTDEFPLPSMELIAPHRQLNLPPSCFQHGCICGHQFEYRETVYMHRRRNTRVIGLTIRPKVAPISARLRRIE